MLAGYLAVLLTVLQLVWAQNITTTIITRVPVSTLTTSVTSSGSVVLAPTTLLSTRTIVSVISTATASATSSPTPTPSPIVLDTKVDAPWAVLGTLLILSGLPSAFWGHKNRWSSFFIIGFYTLSIVCLALILRFGVLQAINPPSQTLRGLFVLSCSVAGFVGGGFAIFFWKGTKYFIGAWGGFAVGLFIQCMNNGGVIKPLGFRWILYSGCAVIGFVLCTIPKIHYHVLLVSTAIVGASAFMLGVDCFTTAGLKEFYVYNLGFRELFPKYAYIEFPVSQTMQIELGMIAAVAIMGASVQARVLIALQARLREINREQDRRNAAVEAKAAARFTQMEKELEEWELAHGGAGPKKPNDLEASRTQTPETPRNSSQFSLFRNTKTAKGRSSVTMADLSQAQPVAAKEERATSPKLDLDLGKSVEEALPDKMLSTEVLETRLSEEEKKVPELQKNIQLLQEIRGIRNTISLMRSEVASPKSAASPLLADPDRRSPTFSELNHTPRISSTVGTGPRPHPSASAARPTSTPALNEWDDYVKNRVLFQPPAGTSAPIAPAPQRNRPHSITLPSAVAQAVEQRQRQERAYEFGGMDAYMEAANGSSGHGHGSRPASATLATFLNVPGASNDDEDIPLSHRRRTSSGVKSATQPRSRTTSQIVILPPNPASAPKSAEQPVVKTFEELSARHRGKMRELQAPLSQREAEQAAINSARERWERSVAVERGVMTRKEQEKLQSRQDPGDKPHTRSRSTFGLNERPTSTAKVQDWQKHQDNARRQQQQPQQQQHRSSYIEGDRTRKVSDTMPRSRSPKPFPSQRPRSQLY